MQTLTVLLVGGALVLSDVHRAQFINESLETMADQVVLIQRHTPCADLKSFMVCASKWEPAVSKCNFDEEKTLQA
eukprot:6180752-Pleurochrysis_carterae.AAC.3